MYDAIFIPQKTRTGKGSYIWPNPFKSDRQYDKFTGGDIDKMDFFEVWREAKKVEDLLAWRENREVMITLDGNPMTRRTWLLQRLTRLKKREDEVV